MKVYAIGFFLVSTLASRSGNAVPLKAELRVAKAKVVVKEPILLAYGVKNAGSGPARVVSLKVCS